METFLLVGYIGLVLIVFEGGLTMQPSSFVPQLPLACVTALVGVLAPIALTFGLYHGYGYPTIDAFAAGSALASTSLGTVSACLLPLKVRPREADANCCRFPDLFRSPRGRSGTGRLGSGRDLERRSSHRRRHRTRPPCHHRTARLQRWRHFRPRLDRGSPDRYQSGHGGRHASRGGLDLCSDFSMAPAERLGRTRRPQCGAVSRCRRPQRVPRDRRLRGDNHAARSVPRRVLFECTSCTGLRRLLRGVLGRVSLADTRTREFFRVVPRHSVLRLVDFLQIFVPLFFISIGFSIPFLQLWTGKRIWRGIVYAILMTIGKLLAGLPVLIVGLIKNRQTPDGMLERTSKPSAEENGDTALDSRPPPSIPSNTFAEKATSDSVEPRGVTRGSLFLNEALPAAAFVGMALVARGEIGVRQLFAPPSELRTDTHTSAGARAASCPIGIGRFDFTGIGRGSLFDRPVGGRSLYDCRPHRLWLSRQALRRDHQARALGYIGERIDRS